MTDTPSLNATDKRGAEGATHPRITLEFMKSQIELTLFIDGQRMLQHSSHSEYATKVVPSPELLSKFTVCMLVLKNGFISMGKSAPLSPENFDAAKGRTFAYEDALRQLWPLFAFTALQAKHENW